MLEANQNRLAAQLADDAGDGAQAWRRSAAGVALLDQLVRSRPDDVQLLGLQAVANSELASAALRVGQVAPAQAAYQALEAVTQRLRIVEPRDVRWQMLEATSLQGRARIAAQADQLPQAGALYAAAIDQMQHAVALDPQGGRSQSRIGALEGELGSTLWALGRLADAATHFTRAAELLKAAYRVEADAIIGHNCLRTLRSLVELAVLRRDPAAPTLRTQALAFVAELEHAFPGAPPWAVERARLEKK